MSFSQFEFPSLSVRENNSFENVSMGNVNIHRLNNGLIEKIINRLMTG